MVSTVILTLALLFVVAVVALLLRDDLAFIRSGRRSATATVLSHARRENEGTISYQARLRFLAEDGRTIEVEDMMLRPTPEPAVGGLVRVVYPAGRPDKARVPRPLLRVLIYAVVAYLAVVLVAHLAGWLR